MPSKTESEPTAFTAMAFLPKDDPAADLDLLMRLDFRVNELRVLASIG